MRPPVVLLSLVLTGLLAGCGALGLGKKRSPFQGVLRFEVERVQRAGEAVRLGVQNDGPDVAAFDPCSQLLLQRFDGVGWVPLPRYRPCTLRQDSVRLAPGAGTALTVAPVPAGVGYRFALLRDGERNDGPALFDGVPPATQSTPTFDVVR